MYAKTGGQTSYLVQNKLHTSDKELNRASLCDVGGQSEHSSAAVDSCFTLFLEGTEGQKPEWPGILEIVNNQQGRSWSFWGRGGMRWSESDCF